MAEKQFWLFSGWCKQSGRGRDAWPARMLMAMLVLRFSEEGMSRRAAVSRARVDMGWRAAMGLPMGGASRSETTVRRFEAFMMQRDPRTGTTRFLLMHEPVVRLSLQDAGLRSRAVWATDSTPMWCYGAVRDTVRLLGDGLRWLGGLYARITGETLGELAATCSRLLRVVAQDLEPNEEGRLVVARRVAENRLISLTDWQARHGRKSKSQAFNGFKLHLLGDVTSGLIASVAVTEGNVHDSRSALRLIRGAKQLCEQMQCVLGDTAYGGAELRHVVVHQVVRYGGRQARSVGLGRAQWQAHLIALRCNLSVFAEQALRLDAAAARATAQAA